MIAGDRNPISGNSVLSGRLLIHETVMISNLPESADRITITQVELFKRYGLICEISEEKFLYLEFWTHHGDLSLARPGAGRKARFSLRKSIDSMASTSSSR